MGGENVIKFTILPGGQLYTKMVYFGEGTMELCKHENAASCQYNIIV